MNASQRKFAYSILAILNAAAFAAQQQGVVPEAWGHYLALASFVLAAAMKEFGAQDTSQ